MSKQTVMDQFRVGKRPNYIAQGNEFEIFSSAFENHIPLIIKGPTGCGKTRFIEYAASRLRVPLITVSCHEDLIASDLVGTYIFKDNQTLWQDGPLTLAARYGGICYLDEIVEARKDTTVVIHSLTDDRRQLYIDKTSELINAHERFMMVLSYNPGYQNIVKDLKHSTKQRFASMVFDHPSLGIETRIIQSETGLDRKTSRRLAELGEKIRELRGHGLEEAVSSRLLVYAGRLMAGGLPPVDACRYAVTQTLTDDPEAMEPVRALVDLYFGEVRGHD